LEDKVTYYLPDPAKARGDISQLSRKIARGITWEWVWGTFRKAVDSSW
jgi:hypothetical protein